MISYKYQTFGDNLIKLSFFTVFPLAPKYSSVDDMHFLKKTIFCKSGFILQKSKKCK